MKWALLHSYYIALTARCFYTKLDTLRWPFVQNNNPCQLLLTSLPLSTIAGTNKKKQKQEASLFRFYILLFLRKYISQHK